MSHLTSTALLCFVLCFAGRATAQHEESARMLFAEGRELAEAGRYADACPKFEQSARLERGMGTLFNLADCYENVGRTASAWSLFVEVATSARHAQLEDRAAVAHERAKFLEPRLVRLTLDVAPAARVEGLEVRVDGIELVREAWGTAMPLDPGAHRVEALAPARPTWTRALYLPARGPDLTIRIASLAPTEPPSRGTSSMPRGSRLAETESEANHAALARVLGMGASATGLATLGVGGLLGLQAKSTYSEALEHCDTRGCDDEGLALRRDAVNRGNIATATSIVGGAVTAGGLITWWIAARHASRERPKVDISVGARSLVLRGRW